MQTLKHIVLDLHHLYDFDVDSLFGIPSELDDMRNKNTIETIKISVTTVHWHPIHWLRGGDDWVFDSDWGRLDDVLTGPGWFSLKRVSVTMRLHRYNGSGLDVTLRNLRRKQFPRLSSSNSVSFNFRVKVIM